MGLETLFIYLLGPPLCIVVFVLINIGIAYVDHANQSPEHNRNHIQAALEAKGCTLVNIQVPKIFNTGPFPNYEGNSKFKQALTLVRSGEKARYRIVTYMDQHGNVITAWLKIIITGFEVQSMEWRADKD